ncbi:MAG: YeeE/YedE thiosulfate transporter family protein, partial [Boseongicola sp.]|nr:YeeE/YedE thiosulfate transporter family protein [Boseongicola sp.]
LIFGVAAQISRFCLRRAVAGDLTERGTAAGVWITGFAAAVVGFLIANAFGLVQLDDHRFTSASLPLVAVVLGGLAFGVGMVLTRGCVSRLTVLTATGNLRALFVLAAFAIAAHAALKGVLSPIRTTLGSFTVDMPFGALVSTNLGLPVFAAVSVVVAFFIVRLTKPNLLHVFLGALIGLVAVAGWMATSTLLFDEFDPLPVQSAAFTLPWSDSLFWVVASTAIQAGFGVVFIGGGFGRQLPERRIAR